MTSFIEQLEAEYQDRQQRDSGERATTEIGGATVTMGDAETTQSSDDGESFLTGSNLRGTPRGKEAREAREISETAPFQMILNAVTDQLLGGELAFPSDDGEEDSAEAELKPLVADVLDGPHYGGADFDDLVSAWVADMAGPGNAYAEFIGSEDVDLPFVALKDVDPLTVRHNVDESGGFKETAFFQAPFRTLAGQVFSPSEADVTPLDQEDLMVMSWPGSHRSNRVYPLPPALQVKEWLEIISTSTKHHSRFYKDNELPPGLLTAREANQNAIDNIRDELEAAKGDPRSAPVVGTDARWVEVGGSAVDLNVIEEQKWFIQLVMAAFGITKTELAMDEQVNYETSEAMLTVVNKRVTQPVAGTIAQAIERQALPQFDLYQALDQPFGVELRYSDPRQEAAEEERALKLYNDGTISLRQFHERTGTDMSDADTTVQINGEEIDYGAYPKPVVESLLMNARNEDPPGTPSAGE